MAACARWWRRGSPGRPDPGSARNDRPYLRGKASAGRGRASSRRGNRSGGRRTFRLSEGAASRVGRGPQPSGGMFRTPGKMFPQKRGSSVCFGECSVRFGQCSVVFGETSVGLAGTSGRLGNVPSTWVEHPADWVEHPSGWMERSPKRGGGSPGRVEHSPVPLGEGQPLTRGPGPARISLPRSRPAPCAQVAQLVEHVTENHGVTGSIPVLGTIKSCKSKKLAPHFGSGFRHFFDLGTLWGSRLEGVWKCGLSALTSPSGIC
jgi:hypothetical protein